MICILQTNNIAIVIDGACVVTCTSGIDDELTQRSRKGRRKGKDTIK
jgi:hypothetical protein